MDRRRCSILFLGKKSDDHVQRALSFCQAHFTQVAAYMGQWNDPWPEELGSWDGDYIISYLSRWVIPAHVLNRAKAAAINFHPASPEYPGVGCNNFALYERADTYGATCHHMAPRVDEGAIIAVKRFPVFPADNVATLLARTYDHQLTLFYEIASLLVQGKDLPVSKETWTRRPFKRKELNELGRITPDMSKEEIANRVRATSFGAWKPTIRVHGFEFELKTQPFDD